MGRGKVELRRIENKIKRQVTFSKRKGGLVKKAHEISVLCDAEVSLIIFSHNAKLFEFSSHSCMEEILDRYERYSFAERRFLESNSKASAVLHGRRSLEQQLDTSLKLIRSRKNQLMHESISELHKKIKDKEKTIKEQTEWQHQNQVSTSTSFLFPQQVPFLNIG